MKRLRSPDRLPTIDVHVRWMIRADHPDVMRIEEASHGDDAFNEEGLLLALRQRNIIAMVAETRDDRIAGFMVYKLKKTSFEILTLAVDPALRRRRVATQMLGKLSAKLERSWRERLTFDLQDNHLGAHLLLRSLGFLARLVIRDEFGTGVDGYRFELAPFAQGSLG